MKRTAVLLALAAGLAVEVHAQFDSPEALTPFRAPQSIASADFDQDGRSDLVVLDEFGRRVTLFRGRNDRTFDGPEVVREDDHDHYRKPILVGDLDGDGDTDLLGIGPDRKVFTFENDSGELGPETQASNGSIPSLSSSALVEMKLVDVDGDGLLDLFMSAASLSNQGEVFVKYASGPLRFRFQNEEWLDGSSRCTFTDLVDADQDGDMDLVYMAWTTGGTTELHLAENTGTWPSPNDRVIATVQGPPFDFSAPDEVINGDLTVGDLDGDGDPDVHFATVGYEWLAYGAPGLDFGAPLLLDSTVEHSFLHLVDLDGDGDLDQVGVRSLGDGVATWRRNTGGTLEPRRLLPTGTAGRHLSLLDDFDGNGFPDLVSRDPDSVFRAAFHRGTGVQPLMDPPKLVVPQLDDPRFTELADFDGDGDVDMVVVENATNDVWLLRNAGPGAAWRTSKVTNVGRVFGLRVGDFDGDGHDDVSVVTDDAAYVSLGVGDGTFEAPTSRAIGTSFLTLGTAELVDLTGDGHVDLAICGQLGTQSQGVLVFPGDGAGGLGAPSTVWQVTTHANWYIAAGDVNGDGHGDLLFHHQELELRLGDGVGGFGPVVTVVGAPEYADAFRLRDLDSDGDLDVAAWVVSGVSPNPGVLRIHENVGGQLMPPIDVDSFPTDFNLYPGRPRLDFFDMEGDGDLDVWAFDGVGGGRRMWVAERTSPALDGFAPAVRDHLSDFDILSTFRTADIDRDGDTDFVWTVFDEDRIGFYRSAVYGDIGQNFCFQTSKNSDGRLGGFRLSGSRDASMNRLSFCATSLPPGALTMFLASRNQFFPVVPPNSIGELCLGGAIGRFVGPGQIQYASATGDVYLDVDMTAIPQPTGAVPILAGEQWWFQAWHRDSIGGAATSNFTSGSWQIFQ